MSAVTLEEITVENILRQIEQLPPSEQLRLRALLNGEPLSAKWPRDKRLPDRPAVDATRERAWIEAHRHEYAGQWVALDGDRLVAASPNQAEVWAAVKADDAHLPLVCRIPAPDEPLPIGI